MIVDGFLKNDREMVVGDFWMHGDTLYGGLKIMMPSAVEEGEWVQRRRGVAFRAEILPALCEAVETLCQTAATDKVVARLDVGREQIWVGVQPFRGNEYAYVRRFYEGEGEWRPTKKGVNVGTHLLDDLVDLVRRMRDAAGGVERDLLAE